MNKSVKLAVTSLLLLALLGSVILPVCAAGAERTISNEEDFLSFARDCVLDTYSSGLTVRLEADLDLTGLDFEGVPIFSGLFDGQGHTVSGLTLTGKGSSQGLFRYLTEGGCIRNLHVEGTVLPEGSRSAIGGVVGTNAGTVNDCSFRGEVNGSDGVGGIAGVNQVSGLIEGCKAYGSIHGSHFIGGIAGKNFGLLRACDNYASVNVTAGENDVSLSDISTNTIIGTESADTVTDVGGITGTSTGLIRGCSNYATVGYQHMGYNIGGIAGSQRGFLTECANYGEIFGRKEIAGIAGQMEPVSIIEYTADTLQLLRQQLSGTAELANQASANVHQNAAQLGSQVDALRNQAELAMDAIDQLLPSKEAPHLPDLDTIHAASITLSSTMSAMQGTMSALQSGAQETVSTAAGDIRAITSQIQAISGTIGTAAENLGGTVTDISDSDTPEDLTGKILNCKNFAPVSGDLNVGGITGAVAWENDLDPEDDFQFTSGSKSLNFDSKLRAVIRDCRNSGVITAKKRSAGGIVGSLTLGLVKDCVSSGRVDAESARYVGGIAGTSTGVIRSCSVKSRLLGEDYVGGIAGQASTVTDCRSLTEIPGDGEKLGSVLGFCTESGAENPVSGNFYLPLEENLGAIDGISYAGAAESLSPEDFLDLPDLSDIFDTCTLTFLFEDGQKKLVTVPLGSAISPEKLPAVPEKEGQLAAWDQLETLDLSHVYFDVTLEAKYEPCQQVLASTQQRENGKPILLAEGEFSSSTGLELTALPELPAAADSMTVLEAWKLPALPVAQTVYHLALPGSLTPKSAAILLQGADGQWREVPASADGSYLVFTAEESDQALCLVKTNAEEKEMLLTVLTGLGLLLLLVVVILLVRRHRKKKKK